MAALIGKKLGMTQVFAEDGTRVPVTVIEAGPCPVTAVRDSGRDGYAAVQLAFGDTKDSRLTKPELGHLKAADAPAQKYLAELRVADLLSPRKTRNLARPRQMAMALCKELTDHSLPEIGVAFGGRDHTTVLHACRRIEELCATDGRLREDKAKLLRLLTA